MEGSGSEAARWEAANAEAAAREMAGPEGAVIWWRACPPGGAAAGRSEVAGMGWRACAYQAAHLPSPPPCTPRHTCSFGEGTLFGLLVPLLPLNLGQLVPRCACFSGQPLCIC